MPNDTQEGTGKFPTSKGIIRVEKRGGFTVLDNTASTDSRLSFKALGIHTYLMTRVDSWQVYAEQLAKTHADGIDSVYSGLRELERAGYLERRTLRDEKGRIIGRESVVYETPRPGFTVTGKIPDTGNPCHGKSQTNKYLPSANTDLQQEKDGTQKPRAGQEQQQFSDEDNKNSTSPCQEPTETAGKGTGQGDGTNKKDVPPGAALDIPPVLLARPGWEESWGAWLAYRRGRKLTVNPMTLQAQLRKLAGWPDPLACIEQSITNGWAGLFPLKAERRPVTQQEANQKFVQAVNEKRSAVAGVFDE